MFKESSAQATAASPQLVPQLGGELVVLRCDRQAEAVRHSRQAVGAACLLRAATTATAGATGKRVAL